MLCSVISFYVTKHSKNDYYRNIIKKTALVFPVLEELGYIWRTLLVNFDQQTSNWNSEFRRCLETENEILYRIALRK